MRAATVKGKNKLAWVRQHGEPGGGAQLEGVHHSFQDETGERYGLCCVGRGQTKTSHKGAAQLERTHVHVQLQ